MNFPFLIRFNFKKVKMKILILNNLIMRNISSLQIYQRGHLTIFKILIKRYKKYTQIIKNGRVCEFSASFSNST